MKRRQFLQSIIVATTAVTSLGGIAVAATPQVKKSAMQIMWCDYRRKVSNALYPFMSSFPGVKLPCPDFAFQKWVDNWEDLPLEECRDFYVLRVKDPSTTFSYSTKVKGSSKTLKKLMNSTCLYGIHAVCNLKMATEALVSGKECDAARKLSNVSHILDVIYDRVTYYKRHFEWCDLRANTVK